MVLYIPVQQRKNIFGRIICPKCGKADKVYKISYGMPQYIKTNISPRGDTTYSRIYNGYYYAGTDVTGVAKYHCERDKIEF